GLLTHRPVALTGVLTPTVERQGPNARPLFQDKSSMPLQLRLRAGRGEELVFQTLPRRFGQRSLHDRPPGRRQRGVGVDDDGADQVVQCVPATIPKLAVIRNCISHSEGVGFGNGPYRGRVATVEVGDHTQAAKGEAARAVGLSWAKQEKELSRVA